MNNVNNNIPSSGELSREEHKKAVRSRLFGDSHGRGSISVGLIMAVIVLVIVANLIVGRLPSNILQADISSGRIYQLSETTKEYLNTLESDIELIMVDQENNIDERVSKFVANYAAYSPHITVSQIDPVMYPAVLEDYRCSASTLVVRNPETEQYQNILMYGTKDAMIVYTYNENTSSYEETAFDGDGQITSAVINVTATAEETVYRLTGHSEEDIPSSVASALNKVNVNFPEKPIHILRDGIPEDCSKLICYAPGYDLAPDEYDLLVDYLAQGGDFVLFLNQSDLENFNSLMKIYGIEIYDGYLGDQMRYFSQFFNLYGYACFTPNISSELSLTANIDADVMALYGHGMTIGDGARDTIHNNRFLWTTSQGYVGNNSDKLSSYALGVLAAENVEKEDGTTDRASLTVISSTAMFDNNIIDRFPNIGNAQLFVNAVTDNLSNASAVSIPAKTVGYKMNTMSGTVGWSLLFIGVIPVSTFVFGLVYWLKRRKK